MADPGPTIVRRDMHGYPIDCLQLATTIRIVIVVAVIVATEFTQCNWHPIIVDADHSCHTSHAAFVSGSSH
jgi:hypothetical protein